MQRAPTLAESLETLIRSRVPDRIPRPEVATEEWDDHVPINKSEHRFIYQKLAAEEAFPILEFTTRTTKVNLLI